MLSFALEVDRVSVVGVSGSQDWGNGELIIVDNIYYGICSGANSEGVTSMKVDSGDRVELVGGGGVKPDVGGTSSGG